MLARDAHAHVVAVEVMQRVEVFEQDGFAFIQRRPGQRGAGGQVMIDFAENPGPALRGAADEQAVGARVGQYIGGLAGRVDVAVGEDRNADRLLDLGNGVVLGLALVQVGPRPTVDGQRLNAGIFGNACDGDAVAVIPVPPGTDLQGDRHLDRLHHGVQDRADELLILHQCRAGGLVADLLGGAAHVDVDDLRAEFDVPPRRFGQHLRIAAGYLHGAGLRIALVRQAQA